jgi:hypothetical protein
MSKQNSLESKFISHTLHKEAMDIDQAQLLKMSRSGFTSPELLSGRSFSTNDTQLQLRHLARHRFIDMRSRKTKNGRIEKVSYSIHNKILFGHANNIVRNLSFGFTDATKELMSLDLDSSRL